MGEVWDVEYGVEAEQQDADDEKDGGIFYDDGEFGVEPSFGFHDEVDGAVHHEQGEGGDGYHACEGVDEVEGIALVYAVFVDGDAPEDVAEDEAEGEGDGDAGSAVADVPEFAPPCHGFFAAEFDGDGSCDEGEEEEDEGYVKGGEDGCVDFGEACEEGAASYDEPDFVAIPYGPDGVEGDAPAFFFVEEEVYGACAEVEAIEDGVA